MDASFGGSPVAITTPTIARGGYGSSALRIGLGGEICTPDSKAPNPTPVSSTQKTERRCKRPDWVLREVGEHGKLDAASRLTPAAARGG